MSGSSKQTYITRNFQKISGKRWELYVITRIIHLLDDNDIEFVCQQYINPPKNENHYFADLAFPSLKLYLEVDEIAHEGKDNKIKDKIRDQEIFEATDWECKRIKTYNQVDGNEKDKELILLNKEIDQFVDYIRLKKKELIKRGFKVAWNYEEKFKPETYIKNKKISVNDNVTLLNHRDVLRLFGYKKGHFQRAVWHIRKFNQIVWFPKLYPNKDWINDFNNETELIHQRKTDGSERDDQVPQKGQEDRIVFAHQKNILGETVYKFIGLFRAELSMSNSVDQYYKRISREIDLTKYQ